MVDPKSPITCIILRNTDRQDIQRQSCCAASLSIQTHGGITSVVSEEHVRTIL